jgi:hypothetical protein
MMAYENLPQSAPSLLKHFGVSTGSKDIAAMLDRARYYSKDILKRKVFENDTELKNRKATVRQRELVAEIVEPERMKLYQLEGAT